MPCFPLLFLKRRWETHYCGIIPFPTGQAMILNGESCWIDFTDPCKGHFIGTRQLRHDCAEQFPTGVCQTTVGKCFSPPVGKCFPLPVGKCFPLPVGNCVQPPVGNCFPLPVGKCFPPTVGTTICSPLAHNLLQPV